MGQVKLFPRLLTITFVNFVGDIYNVYLLMCTITAKLFRTSYYVALIQDGTKCSLLVYGKLHQ